MQPEKQNRRGHRARAGVLEHSSRDECGEHIANSVAAQGSHFVPVTGTNDLGRLRKSEVLEQVEAVPLRWPIGKRADQEEAFSTWHLMAMAAVSQAGASFRTLAVFWRFVNWKTGLLFPSTATLAHCAGACSEKTVKRDLKTYERIGIIKTRISKRRTPGGNTVNTRFIELTIPHSVAANFNLRDIDHGDTSGPHETDGHRDHSCPFHGDTSGPPTFEYTSEEGASRNVSA